MTIRTILTILQRLANIIFDDSSRKNSSQQNITVVGSNTKVTVINGNINHPKTMLPRTKNKVKRFSPKDNKKRG